MKALLTQENWKDWLTAQWKKVWGGLKFFHEVVKDSLRDWSQSGINLHAAALAFYTLLSLEPLVVLTVAVASHFFSYPSVENVSSSKSKIASVRMRQIMSWA